MKQFKLYNNLFGWLIFLFATIVYTLSLEATASFWDCGEFIASAYKLQVGHPPGAPLFLMVAKVFMLFGGGNTEHFPVLVNFLSGLVSGAAILFLFWSITHLARKIIAPKGEISAASLITILGSGLIGAGAFTFSESFWFSAVEGEVYASSMFFTSIVFWAMLKWENAANEKHGDRWIVFIAYLIGLSIGVHLLSLLCIPAIALIYYFKKYKPTRFGIVSAFLLGCAILGFIFVGIIPGVVSLAAKFDLFFVNSLGMGFGSGILFYALLIIGGITWGLWYTHKNNKPIWNTAILSFLFILIGYSSFAQIVIRSAANPPMDENNPENVFTFLSYLNREQYGDRPLLYGQYYNAKIKEYKDGDETYAKGKDNYVSTGRKSIPVYDPSDCTIFPRMYSSQSNHVGRYKEWAGIKGDSKPTFAQNLKFFFSYQLGHMYWRYFMWNFSGRQNDIQGTGTINEGNWVTGFKAIDSMFLGNQDKLPQSMTSNKAYNRFYALPFLLGLIGLIWHFRRHNQDAWVVMLFFLFTGIINLVYLNQPPLEPRERDYSLVGSFYAFAIWIGLGVVATVELLRKKMNERNSGILASVVWLIVPFLMAKDGWDDHNRSKRKTSRDFATNYLNSCAPNAIIFTNGDNDTFPLWYVQDVEGVRTDVRVVNLSLLNTDWYINQMKAKAYESDPVPFSLTDDKYMAGNRDYVPFIEKKELSGFQNLRDIMNFIASEDPMAKVRTQGGSEINYSPSKKFRIPVDRDLVLKNGTVPKYMASKVLPEIDFALDKSYVLKNELMILDLLATNNWKRPIYFAITVGSESYMNLEEYFQLEGLAYRLVPLKGGEDDLGQRGRVETSIMYDNMMNKFKWGNMPDPDVYLDENNLRMTMNFRNNFARLADALLQEGKRDSAIAALDRCVEVMPDANVPYNIFMIRIIENYYKAANFLKNNSGNGNDLPAAPQLVGSAATTPKTVASSPDNVTLEKANAISKRLLDIFEDDLHYYFSLKGKYIKAFERDIQQDMAIIGELKRLAKENKQDALYKELDERFRKLQEQAGG